MKTIAFACACLMLLGSCSGGHAPATATDIITITDNGTTYADTVMWEEGGAIVAAGGAVAGNGLVKEATAGQEVQSARAAIDGPALQCAIHKASGRSVFTMLFNAPSASFPLSFSIAGAVGPAGGVGQYTARNTAGGSLSASSTFAESFTGAQQYAVDSAAVHIAKAEGTAIAGTFTLWLTGASGSKTVTGTIDCHSAGID